MSERDCYQTSIFDGTEQSMLEQSIRLLQSFEESAIKRNPIGYVVGYSGGKDSDALLRLFKLAGVKHFVFHNHTTLDAPETVYHVRKTFAKLESEGIPCKIYKPRMSFWALCLKKRILPTRRVRFCCSELKEVEIQELKFATHSFGVRKAESVKRSLNRDSIEMRDRKDYSDIKRFHFDNTDEVRQTSACYTKQYFIVNPLAYWSDNYLWNFLREEKIEVNPLYNEGFERIGCIGCPMAGKHRIKEFERYPKYRERYIKLCDDILRAREAERRTLKHGFKSGEEDFNYWLTEELPLDELLGGDNYE